MASLTIKNIPDEILAKLRKAAETDRRSLTQEAIHVIEVGLEKRSEKRWPGLPKDEQLKVWREIAGKWQSDLSIEDEVKRIYDARRSKSKAPEFDS
ncbi:hypothetical protein K8I61_13685 [bacterium]|nr:hypothetical protein [bacterium]